MSAEETPDDARSEPSGEGRPPRWVVPAILAVFALTLLALAHEIELTTDEPNYFKAGSALARSLEWKPYNTILHGPVAFLPNQALGHRVPISEPETYKFLGRIGLLPFALLAAWATWRFASRAWGARAGLWALALFCLNPIVLGHGALMTADMSLTCFYMLSLYALWCHLVDPSPLRLFVLGLFLGLALSTKYLGLFLLPAGLGIGLTAVLLGWRPALATSRAPESGRGKSLLDLVLSALVVALVAGLVLHSCYLWRGGYEPLGPTDDPHATIEDQTWGPVSTAFQEALDEPGVLPVLGLLPDAWVRGVDYQKHNSEIGTSVFGDRIGPGFYGYFAVALLLKLPLAALFLILAGLLVRSPRMPPFLGATLGWGIGVPLVFLSCFAPLQVGVRYVLPIVPLLCMLGGRGAAGLLELGHAARCVAAGLATWLVVGALLQWPYFIESFNALASERPYLIFSDSNLHFRLDPDSREVHELLERHPDAQLIFRHDGPRLGPIVTNGSSMVGIDPRDDAPGEYRKVYHWLRKFHPEEHLGAWFVFDLTEADFRRAIDADGDAPDARGLTELAVALLGTGEEERALALLEGVADPDAESVRVALRLAVGTDRAAYARKLLELGRNDLALEHADAVGPEFRALVLFRQGKHEQVIGILGPRLEGETIRPEEAYLLAAAHYSLGSWEEAAKALEAVPADHPSRRELADGLAHFQNRLDLKREIHDKAGTE